MNISPDDSVSRFFEHRIEDGIHVLQPTFGAEATILNPGLTRVATCRSGISSIDGETGALTYRSRHILDIAQAEDDYLSVAFRLICDNPSSEGYSTFLDVAQASLKPTESALRVIENLEDTVHPVDALATLILSSSAHESSFLGSRPDWISKAAFVIAQVHLNSAIVNCWRTKRELIWATDVQTNYIDRVVSLLTGDLSRSSEKARAMNIALVLHAEHGQNCSTSTVRNIASAGGDLTTAICSGLFAFKAPLHGGASEKVPELFRQLSDSRLSADEFVKQRVEARDKLHGFGHRIYRCWDPRAKYMYTQLENETVLDDEILKMKESAFSLAAATALNEFFVSRKIFPNPDLFNGIFFRRVGIQAELNSVILCMSRVAGWIAHYFEQLNDGLPLVRPRQLPKSGH